MMSVRIPTVTMPNDDSTIIVQTDIVGIFIRNSYGRLLITDRLGNTINIDLVKDGIRTRETVNELMVVK